MNARGWIRGHLVAVALAISLVALVVLLAASQHGIATTPLLVLAAVYLLTGCAWVVAQFYADPDGPPAALPWRVVAIVVLVEAELLALFAKQHFTAGIVVSLAAIYLALGALVNRMRAWIDAADAGGIDIARGVLPGLGTTIAGIVAFVIFAKQVPQHRTPLVIGGLAVAAVVVLPVGLNLLSATLLRVTARWAMGLAGAAVVVAAFVSLGVVAHTWKGATWLLIAVAVVMASIVTDTQLDVVLAVVAIGVLGSVRPDVALGPPYQPNPKGPVLAAFGDSYMSGEGASEFFTGTDDAGGNQCRRAPTAWAALAVSPAYRAQTGLDSLAFLACSGAVTTNVEVDGVPQGGTDATQIDEYRSLQTSAGSGQFTPKLAVVSLGGNDAGFSTIGQMCLAPGDCSAELTSFEAHLPAVGQALITAYDDLRAAMPKTPIVAIPYPDPIDTAVRGCGELALTADERVHIVAFLQDLDAEVAYAANQAHVYFASPMVDALAGHQLCDRKAGINFVRLYSISGAAGERFNPVNWLHDSLHPNPLGHRLMLTAFVSWLHSQPPSLRVSAPQRAAPAPAIVASDVTLPELKSQANAWALSQVADDVWPYALVPLGMILGFALLWGAVLGWARTEQT